MKKYKFTIPFIFLFFLCNSHASDLNLFNFFVLNVVDGDTIKVKLANNKIKKIRFSAIDAPEINQTHGIESKKFLFNLIYKKKN
jgi:endonuclease YncB( thermonuclease family)